MAPAFSNNSSLDTSVRTGHVCSTCQCYWTHWTRLSNTFQINLLFSGTLCIQPSFSFHAPTKSKHQGLAWYRPQINIPLICHGVQMSNSIDLCQSHIAAVGYRISRVLKFSQVGVQSNVSSSMFNTFLYHKFTANQFHNTSNLWSLQLVD